MLQEPITIIDSPLSEDIKLSAMKACDSAFTKSVINRIEFKELFRKINTNAEFFIAVNAEEPVGDAAMYANNDKTKEAFITLLGVKHGHHGEHIGTRLMNCCLNTAKNKGMKTVRLEVLDVDKGAQAFYIKQGFFADGRCSSESIFMKKELVWSR